MSAPQARDSIIPRTADQAQGEGRFSEAGGGRVPFLGASKLLGVGPCRRSA